MTTVIGRRLGWWARPGAKEPAMKRNPHLLHISADRESRGRLFTAGHPELLFILAH
jgi:hypothetical protein